MNRPDWLSLENPPLLVGLVVLVYTVGLGIAAALIGNGDGATDGALQCADREGITVQAGAMTRITRDGALWVMTDQASGQPYVYRQRPGELCTIEAVDRP